MTSSPTSAARWPGEGRLFGYRYDGFWKPADTFKERAELDAGYHRGDRPWMVWEHADDESDAGRGRRGPMIPLSTGALTEIAVVGAHCDDIAIGMGGTLLTLARDRSGTTRARHSCCPAAAPSAKPRSCDALAAFCPGADVEVTVLDIPDGRAPAHWERIKNHLNEFPQILRPQSGVRSATRRRSSRSSAACRTVADRVS